MTKARLNAHDERRVAVVAQLDPRTVRTFLERGGGRNSTTSARICDALISCGLSEYVPAPRPVRAA